MIVKRLDRRYTQCRFNDYRVALHFTREDYVYDDSDNGDHFLVYAVKRKLQEYYGPAKYAMFNNPCPWYNEYKNYGKTEIIYLRDESMLSFLELSGAFDESN
jgi:hypothetical protein